MVDTRGSHLLKVLFGYELVPVLLERLGRLVLVLELGKRVLVDAFVVSGSIKKTRPDPRFEEEPLMSVRFFETTYASEIDAADLLGGVVEGDCAVVSTSRGSGCRAWNVGGCNGG